MPPKRSYETSGEVTTSTQVKRIKVQEARKIAVQPSLGSGAAATPGTNVSGAGKKVRINSMKGLPSTVDVEKFTESRSFEIQAMQQAMTSVSSSATHRAWQELPRHLRRRAASHDVRRVPVRLRDRSRKEIDAMKRKALGRSRPKRGKSSQLPRSLQLLKRQLKKKWLESHIWHAKRMHMEDMWGFRLAVKPTEKSFRPSHRASVHGSILHDASYFGLVEIRAAEVVLERMLHQCCDPQQPSASSKRFKGGTRSCETVIYRCADYPFGFIGPVSLIWRPQATDVPSTSPSSDDSGRRKKTGRKRRNRQKGSVPAQAAPVQSESPNPQRTVWVRCHPLIMEEVLVTLRLAASLALETVKGIPEYSDTEFEVDVVDLSGNINVFEVMGPKASQVIRGALTPTQGAMSSKEFQIFWSQLSDVQSSSSVPSNMIAGFTVHDPRLDFPPKNAKPHIDKEHLPSVSEQWTSFPSPTLAHSDIWSSSTREPLRKPTYKKKELDARRAQNAIPGTVLKPTESDNRIPVLLIQRSLGSDNDSSLIHGWTLMVPSGWSMPFIESLVYSGTRVGGQRERQHQSFEAGTPYFPRDFPMCSAYDSFTQGQADRDKDRWRRKPPAKRPNWEKLGTRSPWAPDWDVVLGLSAHGAEDNDFIPTQRAAGGARGRPWLLRGNGVRKVVRDAEGMLNPTAPLWEYVNKARTLRGLAPLVHGCEDTLLQGALVRVKVTLVGRGSPEDMAILYDIPDEAAAKWKNNVKEQSGLLIARPDDEESSDEQGIQNFTKYEVIGYVSSGSYCLSRGEASAIGAMPVTAIIRLRERASRLALGGALVAIRNRDGRVARPAYVDVLE